MIVLITGMILLTIAVLGIIALYSKVEIELIFVDKKSKVFLKLFGIIKIDVKDKTKGERKNKTDFAKIKAFLSGENGEHVKYIISKSDLRVDGKLIYGASTPDVTAVLYGVIYGMLYNIDNILQTVFKTYYRNYSIEPDMKNKKLEYKVTINIYTRVIHYLKFKIRTNKYFKKLEGGVSNGRSTSN